jgi:hypothetical protein
MSWCSSKLADREPALQFWLINNAIADERGSDR